MSKEITVHLKLTVDEHADAAYLSDLMDRTIQQQVHRCFKLGLLIEKHQANVKDSQGTKR